MRVPFFCNIIVKEGLLKLQYSCLNTLFSGFGIYNQIDSEAGFYF